MCKKKYIHLRISHSKSYPLIYFEILMFIFTQTARQYAIPDANSPPCQTPLRSHSQSATVPVVTHTVVAHPVATYTVATYTVATHTVATYTVATHTMAANTVATHTVAATTVPTHTVATNAVAPLPPGPSPSLRVTLRYLWVFVTAC